MQSTAVSNNHYDEAVDVVEADEQDTNAIAKTGQLAKKKPFVQPKIMTVATNETNSDEELESPADVQAPLEPIEKAATDAQPSTSNVNQSEESEEEEEEEDDEDDVHGGAVEGAYDAAEYEHLQVTPEVKELFSYILRYTPQTIELEHKLKPFIPDFIPAVGDIDAFVKVSRPDSKPEILGLTVLDEPSAKQSDSSVLDLQLRAVSKHASVKSAVVKTLENAEKIPKEIDNWIKNISDLHKSKPPPTVHYSKAMPDVDILMQEWDPEFEELLKEVGLPSADLDCDLQQYAEIVCNILDIPIHKSKIQSLHVVFTLYAEFKNSQHFRQLAEKNLIDNADKNGDGVERFVLQ